MTDKPSILFIDSEIGKHESLLGELESHCQHTIDVASKIDEISSILVKNQPDIVFLDVTFAGNTTGLQLYDKLCQSLAGLLIAVLPENNTSIRSHIIKSNPFFYITKPYDQMEVQLALKRALEKFQHSREAEAQKVLNSSYCGIIGQSDEMTSLFELIGRVAEDDYATVLIRGESGTGKELVAKAIHQKSNRSQKNFVPVNCAAIPDDLLESELFGHTKGAFTGATQTKQGRIQYADGGTLFLDEIGDMKPTLQAKLLRVIQEKEFEPVGGLQSTPVDTRILAATHCDLEQLVKEGRFREDLYYRLSVVPIHIPPLKSRKEDIPLLIESFIQTYTVDRGREKFNFSRSALEKLLQYTWRGNVRELENLIQHMSILFAGKKVDISDLPEKYLLSENLSADDVSHLTEPHNDEKATDPAPAIERSFSHHHHEILKEKEIDFKEVINEFETKLIINALKASGGNKKEAARLLNLKRTTLLEKIKKKKLDLDTSSEEGGS